LTGVSKYPTISYNPIKIDSGESSNASVVFSKGSGEQMDIEGVITQLRDELARLDQAIEVFEQLAEGKERRRKRSRSGSQRGKDDAETSDHSAFSG